MLKKEFRHRIEQSLILFILFALVFSSFSSVLTVKADDPKVVYVVVCVDTEFWAGAGHDAYLGTTNPHPTFDVREYSRTTPMNVAEVFNSAFRQGTQDSYGHSVK